jgi:dolichol-phosphate mannosyltransferase
MIIPTFFEKDNISILIPRLLKNLDNVDILIIDDNSTDGTVQNIEKLQKVHTNLYLIKRSLKMGVASAYIIGYDWGLKRKYKYIGQMDADLSHRIRDLSNLVLVSRKQESFGVIIGSRWISGGSTENWPIKRILLSKLGNLYIRIMLNLQVKDSTAGFRIYSSKFLEKIDFNKLESRGFSFQVEMLKEIINLNGKIIEIPIIFRERVYGRSKITWKIILEAYLYVTKIGLQNKFNKYFSVR